MHTYPQTDNEDGLSDKFLADYYPNQYQLDLKAFKLESPTHKKYGLEGIEGKGYFVTDLDYFRSIDHPLLKKKYFVYFMVINTAFLMTVHKYFYNKYEEYKIKNLGVLFEFGLTNAYVYPWEILRRLKIGFNKRLFQNCLGYLISDLLVENNLCGIIPKDFMDKLINDQNLTDKKLIIGRMWAEMCSDKLSKIKNVIFI